MYPDENSTRNTKQKTKKLNYSDTNFSLNSQPKDSLCVARNHLNNLLKHYSYEHYDLLLLNCRLWWQAYKEWEANDTFEKAFQQDRMTIRTYNPDKKGSSTKWNTTWPTTVIKDKNSKTSNINVKCNVSGNGVILRTKSSNFFPFSSKNECGLHDLSASLLNSKKRISDQIYHNLTLTNTHGARSVFMPLPLEEDLQLISLLNDIVQRVPFRYTSQLGRLVKEYNSKMTRLWQASPRDLGAGNYITDPDNLTYPDIKYGVNGKFRNSKGQIVRATTSDLYRLKMNAIQYKRILPKMSNYSNTPPLFSKSAQSSTNTESAAAAAARLGDAPPPPTMQASSSQANRAYNEVVITYREHANPDFPMFGEWRIIKEATGATDRGAFLVIDPTDSCRSKGKYITDHGRHSNLGPEDIV